MNHPVPPGRLCLLVCFLPALAQAQSADVTITADRTRDYRTDETQIGPLGAKSLIDTPYSFDVVPDSLSRDQQLKSVREIFRYLPSVQGENIRPQTRGLQAGVVQN